MSVEYDDLPASSGLDPTSTFLASVAGVKGVETIANLATLLATSGDVAKGLTTVETLSASGTWGDAAIMITDAASTLALTMPTIPTLTSGQAMRRFLVVLPSTHPVNPVAAGGQTYHGATGITDDGTYSVVEMIAINNDGDLEWTGVQLTTGAQLAGLSAFCSGLSGDLTAHTGSTSNPHAVTAAQAGAVSATGHTAKSAIVADASGNVVDLTPTTADRLFGWASSAIAWIQITLGMIPDSLITLPKLADAAAHTILTRSANSTGAVAAQSVGTDEGLFNVAGVITSQKAQTANIADNAVTLAKLATQATHTVLANVTGSTAVPTAVALTSAHMHGIDGLIAKSASFAVGATEWAFNVSTAAGAVVVTMPDPALFVGRGVFLHKSTNDANGITPAPFGSELFNGAAAALLSCSQFSNYPSWYIFSDGTDWHF